MTETVAIERFNVWHTVTADPGGDFAGLDLKDWLLFLGDTKLAEAGGQRVGDWRWEGIVESESEFYARIGALRSMVGEPWDKRTPDDVITADDVDLLRELGPQQHIRGVCRAVRP